jgi:hypothetical protein
MLNIFLITFFLPLPNLGSSHIVAVLSRFTRSPAQTQKQSNIFKDCSREFLSSQNISPPDFGADSHIITKPSCFYKFVWDGKPDNIKRNIIINNYEEEGLKLPHIQSFCKTLKMSWLHKLLDPMNMSPWKILLLSYIEKNMAEIRYYS